MAALKKASDQGSPALDQLAFADFVARGELDRHLRRMRPIYHRRRDRLVEAPARHLPELAPLGAAGGRHGLAWVPAGPDPLSLSSGPGRGSLGVSSGAGA